MYINIPITLNTCTVYEHPLCCNGNVKFVCCVGTNGSALFIFTDAARTEMYSVRIEATFGSETRVLENSVRSGISVLLNFVQTSVFYVLCFPPYITST